MENYSALFSLPPLFSNDLAKKAFALHACRYEAKPRACNKLTKFFARTLTLARNVLFKKLPARIFEQVKVDKCDASYKSTVNGLY